MTFSQQVKEELLTQDINYNIAKYELIAVFKTLGVIENFDENIVLIIKSYQIKLITRVVKILKKLYPNIEINNLVSNGRNFNKNKKLYTLQLYGPISEMLYDLKLIDKKDLKNIFFLKEIDINLLKEQEKKISTSIFFCDIGSANNPQCAQQYHLELTLGNIDYLNEIKLICKKYNVNFKITKRKNNNAIYLNKSEEIADFLKFINCKETLFAFEEYRILRDIKLVNNRLNNADIANEMKRLKSFEKQIEAISFLKKNDKLKDLNEKTQKIAKLREDNPDASLQDLSDLSNGIFSKSLIRYHINILIEKYDKLKMEE